MGGRLRPHYSRGDDEGRSLLREAFTLSGDLQIIDTTLHVRLDPASAPMRSKALAALCAELTDTKTRYPGTDQTLASKAVLTLHETNSPCPEFWVPPGNHRHIGAACDRVDHLDRLHI